MGAFISAHPWMTFFIVLAALSTVGTIVGAKITPAPSPAPAPTQTSGMFGTRQWSTNARAMVTR